MNVKMTKENTTGFAPSNPWGGGVYLRFLVCALGLCATLVARATEWTYSSTAKTITDGQWTLKVSSLDKEIGTLGLNGIGGRADSTASGVIDLRSPLVLKDDSDDSTIAVSMVNLGASAFADWSSKYNITEFYCDIIGSMGDNCFSTNGKMTTIEIGGTAETLPGLMLNKCTSLKTVKFNFPNLRKVGDRIFGVNTNPNPIDISTIAVPSVTNVFAGGLGYSALRGDIVLTNVMFLGASAFQGASLTNVFLAGSLTNLPSQVFRGNSTITNVVLDLPNLTIVDKLAFGHPNSGLNQQKISRVEFVSALKEMGLVTNIVTYSNNKNAPENLRIYVSKKQWTPGETEIYDATTNPTGFFSPLTDDEKAKVAADPTLKGAFGVLVSKGYRKAFFVHKPSIHDKQTGFLIRLCGAPKEPCLSPRQKMLRF